MTMTHQNAWCRIACMCTGCSSHVGGGGVGPAALGAATAAPNNTLADRVSKVFLSIPFVL
jgi:hypothetical protein